MAFEFFVIPARTSGSEAEDLNRFLRGHRVLTVDRRWVEQGWESFWGVCVEYLDVSPRSPVGLRDRGTGAKPPIDYRRYALMGPRAAREHAGDGNFGGFYERPEADVLAMWEIAVQETRALIEGPWL